jgi:ERF superfamily
MNAALPAGTTGKMIHGALLVAMREIAEKGIGKTKQADQAGGAKYRYRGIDDAMNAMSVVLIHAGITVTPEYSDLQLVERARGAAGDGKATRLVILKGSFTFEAADGSFVTASAYGEAADTMDKAVTKAQSVAFRTVLFQQFIVPLMAMDVEDEDVDAQELPEVALNHAEKGTKAYQAFWERLTVDEKKALEKHHTELKAIAKDADAKVAA